MTRVLFNLSTLFHHIFFAPQRLKCLREEWASGYKKDDDDVQDVSFFKLIIKHKKYLVYLSFLTILTNIPLLIYDLSTGVSLWIWLVMLLMFISITWLFSSFWPGLGLTLPLVVFIYSAWPSADNLSQYLIETSLIADYIVGLIASILLSTFLIGVWIGFEINIVIKFSLSFVFIFLIFALLYSFSLISKTNTIGIFSDVYYLGVFISIIVCYTVWICYKYQSELGARQQLIEFLNFILFLLFTSLIFRIDSLNLITFNVNGSIVTEESLGFETLSLSGILSFIIRIFVVIAGLAALIYMLLGVFAWIMSGGDADKIEDARERIQAALVGMIMIVVVLALIWSLENLVFQRRVGLGLSVPVTLPGLIESSNSSSSNSSSIFSKELMPILISSMLIGYSTSSLDSRNNFLFLGYFLLFYAVVCGVIIGLSVNFSTALICVVLILLTGFRIIIDYFVSLAPLHTALRKKISLILK